MPKLPLESSWRAPSGYTSLQADSAVIRANAVVGPSRSGVDYGYELSWAVLMNPLGVVLTIVINSRAVVHPKGKGL